MRSMYEDGNYKVLTCGHHCYLLEPHHVFKSLSGHLVQEYYLTPLCCNGLTEMMDQEYMCCILNELNLLML